MPDNINKAIATVFISGPEWVPRAYYDYFYADDIETYAQRGCKFVLGAAGGIDLFAQEQLLALGINGAHVSVYNKGDKDGRISPLFTLVNGFEDYPTRDRALVDASTFLLAVLPQMDGGQSGVLQSVLSSVHPECVDVTGDIVLPAQCTPEEATSTLACVRRFSEPAADKELSNAITKVYDDYYTAKVQARNNGRVQPANE